MRLDETMHFPYQMTLGALSGDAEIYEMGREIARQCRRIGIHVNFAPTVDINHNPRNPVIGFRSLGKDREQVAARAYAYMQGMQDEGLLAVAKHFPGHGNTDQDSHHTLPLIPGDKAALWHTELFPYRQFIPKGLGAVMVAHLHVPALDPAPGLASTLSRPIVTDLLRGELGFEGIVFTDAMDMKGVAEAYIAGNDVMIFCKNVPVAIAEIRKAVERGEISEAAITEKCRRVLAVKKWVGLDAWQPVEMQGLMEDLHRPAAYGLLRDLYAGAMTLASNAGGAIPLAPVGKIASLAVHVGRQGKDLLAHHSLEKGELVAGETALTPFQTQLEQHVEMDHFVLRAAAGAKALPQLLQALAQYGRVILSIHGIHIKALNRFGIDDEALALLRTVWTSLKPVTVVFGSPYTLEIFEGIGQAAAVVLAYQETEAAQVAAADAVFGKIPLPGRTPF
mgnify:CR=1 FL=1